MTENTNESRQRCSAVRGNADGRSPGFRWVESGYQGLFGERSAGSLKIKEEVCSELIKLAR